MQGNVARDRAKERGIAEWIGEEEWNRTENAIKMSTGCRESDKN